MDIIFETEHLIIRKFKKEDAEQLYLNHREEALKKWFPNESYIDINEAIGAIDFYLDCANNNRMPYVLAVELKRTGELIGDTGVSETEVKENEVEIGYQITEKYKGNGYATELLNAMTQFSFDNLDSAVVWGRVVFGNVASARVLEKGGYTFVEKEMGAEDDPYGNGMLVYKKERK